MNDTPNRLAAVLFDIDGTLIDSNDLHVKAWGEAFQEAGHQIAPEDILAQIGKGGDNLLPTLLPETDDDERERLTRRHGEIFKARYLDQAKPFPGAADLLRRVHADGRKVVLASSAERDELEHYVELLGVKDIIAAGTSGDDVESSKPAPDIFTAALKKAGVAASEALVVGDTIWDVKAARKAGLRTVALLSGGVARAALEEAGAAAIFDDVGRLFAHYDGTPLAANRG